MILPLPQVKDLVLVGGGHAHVHVLKAFAMRPVAGLRITLITREINTPYSGMLPGHVVGSYSASDVHIDLLRLARYAGARLFVGEVTQIDPDKKTLRFNQPESRQLRYDLLSINTGAAPNCPFDLPQVVPVKPIGRFLPGWQRLAGNIATGQRLAVVGGGAGGFEIALAAQRQLGVGVSVSLISSGRLLPEQGDRVRSLAFSALAEAGVELREGFRVETVTNDVLRSTEGDEVPAVGVLWVTGVSAPNWLAQSGLQLDKEGFIEVDRYLRSVSAPDVYAVGDVASMRDQPRPKAGVFAVRQGPFLAGNLRAAALAQPAKARPYKAQSKYLALLNCADGTAIASYGGLALRSKAWWRLKDWIDTAFMTRFNTLPAMNVPGAKPRSFDELRSAELGTDMRCGGCGSKLNASLLSRVLRDLEVVEAPWVIQGIGDDAAVLLPASGAQVLTTDGFRSMLDDTRLLGRVAAHHALSDVYAMGAQPTAALLNATIPLMSEPMMEAELRDLLSGVLDVLREDNVPLVGGHSAEGLELSVALTISGTLGDDVALRKTAGEAGDLLVLTQPLGTGSLLAAAMRGECDASDWQACLGALDVSNKKAAEIVRRYGANGCTDVTGFGLIGHLQEMLGQGPEALGAQLTLSAIPLLSGAAQVVAAGITSSLHEANARAFAGFEVRGAIASSAEFQLLADPQTAGGLLATVPPNQAQACVQELQAAGYSSAVVIGELTESASLIVP